MPEAPTNPIHQAEEKPNKIYRFFAHSIVYMIFTLIAAGAAHVLADYGDPLEFLIKLPLFFLCTIPLLFGQIGMVMKRKYVQAILGLFLVAGMFYTAFSISRSITNAYWRKREPVMILLADTIMHDPKYADTKGTVEIPLPENLSKFSNGKPLRADFSRHHKGSCRIYYFWYDTASDENFYCIYESDPHNYILSDGDEYIGNIRKNFHLKPAN